MGFFPPQLKHILKNNIRCWAICFFTASVMGILSSPNDVKFLCLPKFIKIVNGNSVENIYLSPFSTPSERE
jgi:hypothetical protein